MVSILVMMDLSFWQLVFKWLRVGSIGFNPCYDGFVFLTVFPTYSDSLGVVSILVMMDLSFWPIASDAGSGIILFQSLLWWICLFDPTTKQEWNICSRVSILVMMDLSFWPTRLHEPSGRIIGFNPCYDGFVFLTVYYYQSYVCFCNVSILVMMDLSFWQWHTLKEITNLEVSILVMMDLSFWQYISWNHYQCIHVFQSLLWWICLFDSN